MHGDDHDRDRPLRPHCHDPCTSTAYACPPTMLESSEIYRALLSSPIYRELTLNTHITASPSLPPTLLFVIRCTTATATPSTYPPSGVAVAPALPATSSMLPARLFFFFPFMFCSLFQCCVVHTVRNWVHGGSNTRELEIPFGGFCACVFRPCCFAFECPCFRLPGQDQTITFEFYLGLTTPHHFRCRLWARFQRVLYYCSWSLRRQGSTIGSDWSMRNRRRKTATMRGTCFDPFHAELRRYSLNPGIRE